MLHKLTTFLKSLFVERPHVVKPTDSTYYFDDHYLLLKKQPIEVMQETLTPDQFLGFLKGNMIKYEMRAGLKKGESYEKDHTKFQRYHEWYVMALTGQKIDPRK